MTLNNILWYLMLFSVINFLNINLNTGGQGRAAMMLENDYEILKKGIRKQPKNYKLFKINK